MFSQKTTKILFLLIIYSNSIHSKDSLLVKNSIYAEILGNAAGLSLNYDRVLFKKEKVKISFCIGIGAVPSNLINKALNNPQINYVPYGIPVSLSLYYGSKNHHIETGIGLTYQEGLYGLGEKYTKTIFAVGRLGYRYQKENGGFFWKIGITPFLVIKEYGTYSTPVNIVPLGGVGFGYTLPI